MRLAHSAEYILCAHTTKYDNFHLLRNQYTTLWFTCRATRYGWTDTDQFLDLDQKEKKGTAAFTG
jgi:hypothetical protein